MIVRTAAEGASAEDIERDIDFLQRLWKEIQGRAEKAKAPALVYQEAELPSRVVRDLFTNDFEQAVVDHDLTYKRIVGYLKKTSPHMAEKVRKHTGKTALFEDFGVDEEIRSTLSRRVDLPSGGYLVFDYAEAFTVIDVNTGRFVGSRSKSSAGRLEDTITKNNLEAVKEVVRQLRLRDIGGIIVIDFIDMANPKNRAAVEEALKTELERDRTKTYVVEISPLGLVEMTRQNVSHGPREILTQALPDLRGRRHRLLGGLGRGRGGAQAADARGELAQRRLPRRAEPARRGCADRAGAERLEHRGADPPPVLHRAEGGRAARALRGRRARPAGEAPARGAGRGGTGASSSPSRSASTIRASASRSTTAIDIAIAGGAKLVGKRAKVRITRVLDGTAYAELADGAKPAEPPITAEALAEKPTRARRSRIAKPEEPKAEAVAGRAVRGAGGGGRRGGARGAGADRGRRCRGGAQAEEAHPARVARRPAPEEEAGRGRGGGNVGAAARQRLPKPKPPRTASPRRLPC